MGKCWQSSQALWVLVSVLTAALRVALCARPPASAGPVLHWSFDGPNDTSRLWDSSGNGLAATIGGGAAASNVSWAPGVVAGTQALRLAPTWSTSLGEQTQGSACPYLVSPVLKGVGIRGMAPFTLAAWLRPDLPVTLAGNFGSWVALMGSYRVGVDSRPRGTLEVLLLPRQVLMAGAAGMNLPDVLTVQSFRDVAGEWMHVALAYDGAAGGALLSMYFNGLLARSIALKFDFHFDSVLTLGYPGVIGHLCYSGLIDDLRIYNRELAPAEIYGLWSGVCAGPGRYVPAGVRMGTSCDEFDCTAGTTDNDSDSSTACVTCSAGQYAAMGSHGPLPMFGIYFRDLAIGSQLQLLRDANATWFHAPYYMFWQVGYSVLQVRIAGDSVKRPECSVESSTWIHVTHVYDGLNTVLYINGAMAVKGAMAINMPASPMLTLAKRPPTDESQLCFKGLIDDLRVYDRDLSPQEVFGVFHEFCGPGHYVPKGNGSTDNDSDPSTPCVMCGPGHYFTAPGVNGSCDLFACAPGTQDTDNDEATPCTTMQTLRRHEDSDVKTLCTVRGQHIEDGCGAGGYEAPGSNGLCSGFACTTGTVDHDANPSTPCAPICSYSASEGVCNASELGCDWCGKYCALRSQCQCRDVADELVCMSSFGCTWCADLSQCFAGSCPVDSTGSALGLAAAGLALAAWMRRKQRRRMQQYHDEVTASEIVLGELLGQGSFGVVYKALWRDTEVAAKVLSIETLQPQDIDIVSQEVDVMRALRHPNILLFMCHAKSAESFIIVTGSLMDLLANESKGVPLRRRLAIMSDIARGMAYLHQNDPPILHRDLKSSNILLDSNLQAKVSDFGLTLFSRRGNSHGGNEAVIGTIFWTAPEVLAYGIIVWEIMTREVPYDDQNPYTVALRVTKEGMLVKQLKSFSDIYIKADSFYTLSDVLGNLLTTTCQVPVKDACTISKCTYGPNGCVDTVKTCDDSNKCTDSDVCTYDSCDKAVHKAWTNDVVAHSYHNPRLLLSGVRANRNYFNVPDGWT
eukprot:m51a1_g1534 putative flag-tagged protein kinase domain of mitogen-activated protein kinase kinase kinase (1022) ;mRNA; f:524909-534704